MTINNKTLAAVEGITSAVGVSEQNFRTGMVDFATEINTVQEDLDTDWTMTFTGDFSQTVAVNPYTTDPKTWNIALNLLDGSVDTGDLADSAVTTVKINDDAVTNAKIADDAVDTAQIADDAVEQAQVADAALVRAHVNGAVRLRVLDASGTALTTLYGFPETT